MDAQSNSDLNLTPETETLTSSDGPQPSKEIRRCNQSDEDQIVEWALKFIAYSPYSMVPVDENHIRELFRQLLKDGVVLRGESGFIAGTLSPLFFSPSVLIAAELAWWSENGEGDALREAFHEWARDCGVEATQLSVFNNQYMGDLSKRLVNDGYKPLEISFIKAL